jgi:DNA-directed RNA polymerase specialized sigma24 family protein
MEDGGYTLSQTGAEFQPTHWTVLLEAGRERDFEPLCRTYWPPVYAFLRMKGHSREDARDLTQGFFLHLLAKGRLERVHPSKGKFRSFLLACLENYVHNERDKGQALKRGAQYVIVPIDLEDVETRIGVQPATEASPAVLFQRQWAVTLIGRVFERLEECCARKGKPDEFEALNPFLTGESERHDYRTAAEKLGISEGAARTRASRLRDDFGRLLREEIEATVDDPAETDDEIRSLFTAFQTS